MKMRYMILAIMSCVVQATKIVAMENNTGATYKLTISNDDTFKGISIEKEVESMECNVVHITKELDIILDGPILLKTLEFDFWGNDFSYEATYNGKTLFSGNEETEFGKLLKKEFTKFSDKGWITSIEFDEEKDILSNKTWKYNSFPWFLCQEKIEKKTNQKTLDNMKIVVNAFEGQLAHCKRNKKRNL